MYFLLGPNSHPNRTVIGDRNADEGKPSERTGDVWRRSTAMKEEEKKRKNNNKYVIDNFLPAPNKNFCFFQKYFLWRCPRLCLLSPLLALMVKPSNNAVFASASYLFSLHWRSVLLITRFSPLPVISSPCIDDQSFLYRCPRLCLLSLLLALMAGPSYNTFLASACYLLSLHWWSILLITMSSPLPVISTPCIDDQSFL